MPAVFPALHITPAQEQTAKRICSVLRGRAPKNVRAIAIINHENRPAYPQLLDRFCGNGSRHGNLLFVGIRHARSVDPLFAARDNDSDRHHLQYRHRVAALAECGTHRVGTAEGSLSDRGAQRIGNRCRDRRGRTPLPHLHRGAADIVWYRIFPRTARAIFASTEGGCSHFIGGFAVDAVAEGHGKE